MIGVSTYQAVSSLPAAVRDDVLDVAVRLSDPATGIVAPSDVTILLDREVTAATIRSALESLALSVPGGGTVAFYFSGHGHHSGPPGSEESWLLPHDADLARLAETAISSSELVARLDALEAGRQIVMIDACHAGGIGKGGRQIPKGFGGSGVEALSRGGGRVLLTSCRADEESAILRGERNSVFTGALLEALDGAALDRGDGYVRVFDVFDYVSAKVPKRFDQHPIFHAGGVDGNFPIARRSAVHSVERDLTHLVRAFSKLYPAGPTQDALWARAGGDVSQLHLSGSGLAQWHSALSKAMMGGGGLTVSSLIATALEEYPGSDDLRAAGQSFG